MSAPVTMEKEISYTINLSQDLLFYLHDEYIKRHFALVEEYYDLTDTDGVRTRIFEGTTAKTTGVHVECVHKTLVSLTKFVHVTSDILVPFVDRVSEECPLVGPKPTLRRVARCLVYADADFPQVEVKFETVYMEQYAVDSFDSLMATKQITLLNPLRGKSDSTVKNLHLGSDEILAHLRLEYEYGGEVTQRPQALVLDRLAHIVRHMDELAAKSNVSPLIASTTLQNNIIYRKFAREHLLTPDAVADVHAWALKLDGVRGKGYFTRDEVLIFMDDMRLLSGRVRSPFSLNNVVAFQCELLPGNKLTVYVTDLLHVFKYSYNNRTQYECSLDAYDVDAASAVRCLNDVGTSKKDSISQLNFVLYDGAPVEMKFQKFYYAPFTAEARSALGYSTLPSDGYVVLDVDLQYAKYKHCKTREVQYDAATKQFLSSQGPMDTAVTVADDVVLAHGNIYEAAVNEDRLHVIKARPDRLVPN
jgi:Late expression factor 4 (LEF-4)